MRATPKAGQRQLTQWEKKHKLTAFITLVLQDTQLIVEIDEAKQAEAALLDGCSVLETDVARETMDASTVDARYRDLQRVERDFRTMKTGLLELRPIFVRKERRTRGHIFAAMLALKVDREGERRLKEAFETTEQSAQALTLDDALNALSRLCFQRQNLGGQEDAATGSTRCPTGGHFRRIGDHPTHHTGNQDSCVGRALASSRPLILQ